MESEEENGEGTGKKQIEKEEQRRAERDKTSNAVTLKD